MKKIKILNVISKLNFGGVESVVYNYYSNMNLENFDINILTKKSSNPEEIKKFKKIGFKIIMIDDWEKKPFSAGKKIFSILKSGKYDIIHCHLSHTNFYFLILAMICNIKIRISHSHLSQKEHKLIQRIKHYVYKLLTKFSATNKVACGVDAGKLLYGEKKEYTIFNNAINTEKFKFNNAIREQYRNNLKIPKDSFVVGHIGRLTQQKNQLFLIEIFKEITKLQKNTRLIIIGSGEKKEEIEKKIKEEKLNDKVIMLENRNDVYNLYQVMDVFLLPSLYEGLPVVGIEAQAAGLPCVFSTAIDSSVSVSSKNVFIGLEKEPIKWAEKIVELNLQENSRENVLKNTHYDIKTEAQKLEQYYKKIYDNGGNRNEI